MLLEASGRVGDHLGDVSCFQPSWKSRNDCWQLPQGASSLVSGKTPDRRRILADYCRLFDKIRGVNKGLEIVLSVSPYRYSKLGYAQSNTSKAILLLAAERMSEIYGHVSYFPAYEILKDELRD